MEWYLKCMRQYADFSGRARRKEYWNFVLFYVLFSIIIAFLFVVYWDATYPYDTSDTPLGFAYVFVLGCFIPYLAVTARRFHDIGKSGWFYLLSFVPVVGSWVVLYFMVQDSQPGPNQYGENPKEIPAVTYTDIVI